MKPLLLIVLTVFLILDGCDEEERYKILSFFFDGVPVPPSLVAKSSTDTDSTYVAEQSVQERTRPAIRTTRNEKTLYLHKPYKSRQCGACHQTQGGQKLVTRLDKLCQRCHEQFENLPAFVHGPVAVGQCIACHNPHSSENAYLLLRKGDSVCLYCHDQIDMDILSEHSTKGSKECVDCHSPHFSDTNRFFIWNSGSNP